MKPWIGVDLDGTIATYDGWKGALHIGAPIPKMVDRVKALLADGKVDVKIFTARVAPASLANNNLTLSETEGAIQDWCMDHLGCRLPVTCIKDFGMIMLWDDRCKQVGVNTGEFIEDKMTRLSSALDAILAEAQAWHNWIAEKAHDARAG